MTVCNHAASNYVVVFLRLLTSAQIRTDPESFEPFLFHPDLGEPLSIRDFCEGFVEAVGKEAGAQLFPSFDTASVHDLLRFGSLSWLCRSCPSNRALTGSQDQRERRVFGRSRSGWESRLRGILQCSGGWYRTARVVVPVSIPALAFVSC